MSPPFSVTFDGFQSSAGSPSDSLSSSTPVVPGRRRVTSLTSYTQSAHRVAVLDFARQERPRSLFPSTDTLPSAAVPSPQLHPKSGTLSLLLLPPSIVLRFLSCCLKNICYFLPLTLDPLCFRFICLCSIAYVLLAMLFCTVT